MKKITLFAIGIGFLTAINLTAMATTFSDENQLSDWSREAVLQMKENEVMTGYEDGSFGPKNYVTREELATILERFEEKRIPSIIDEYAQSKLDAWNEGPEEPEIIKEASIDDDMIRGNVNAPVTIVEFSDFECPFCGQFHKETLPLLLEKYISTGKVRVVLRDFPLSFHLNAQTAAMAAECVKDQGKNEVYWAYTDMLFQNQNMLDLEKLKEYAKTFALNQTEFSSCLEEGKFEAEIDHDIAEGKSYGVNGTPTFFIKNKMINGAQPYEVFEKAIEEALLETK